MAIQLISTLDAAINKGVKILIHGPAGSGKTFCAATTGAPTLILSAEAGLLTLKDYDIPAIEVKSIDDINEAFDYITKGEGQAFEWIILDSISEIAEVVLTEEKAQTKDPRKAYGELQDHMMKLLRSFRDLKGKNVVFTCKQDYLKDDNTGITRYSPLMPGQNLQKQIPYIFDFVLALRAERGEDDQIARFFQTQADLSFVAKSRGGALDLYEPPNLAHIANKLKNNLSTNNPELTEVLK